MNGFLLVDKPSGVASAQCVYKIRSILNKKKVMLGKKSATKPGHTK